jgi:hypothetical protein
MIAVITLTRQYGGIDVLWASLLRQRRRDMVWIVADQLLEERQHVWQAVAELSPFPISTYCLPIREGMVNCFASSMNWGLDLARWWNADLAVSIQDYFWIPDDGLARYERACTARPNDLHVGLASIMADPGPEKVFDRKGLFSIFETPWTTQDRPRKFDWRDVREQYPQEEGNHIHWELNYAAIAKEVLYSEIRFPLEFEAGCAFDNQAYAWLAHWKLGSRVWLDKQNHALGLPHKLYYPEIEEREVPYSWRNRDYFEEWKRTVLP